MKFNKTAIGAFSAALIGEASATGACPASIEAVSAADPLTKLVACTKAPTTTPANESAYNALATTCLSSLSSAAGDAFPANTGTSAVCYACYLDFAKAMVTAGVGSWASGSFVAVGDSLNLKCSALTTAAGKETCFKESRILAALNDFQTCAGYSLIYPASGDMEHRRELYRAETFSLLVRNAFNANTDITGRVEDVINGDVLAPATGVELMTEVCFAQMHEHLSEYAQTGDAAVVNNCGSTAPTVAGCYNTTIMVETKARFAKCAGFEADKFYAACTADQLTALGGSYDGYGMLIDTVIANWNVTTPAKAFDWTVGNVTSVIANSAGADCAVCFTELAGDIKTNIEGAMAASPLVGNQDLIDKYLASCDDSSADSCLVVLGADALTNYQQCAGAALNRGAFVASTTTTTTTLAPSTSSEGSGETSSEGPSVDSSTTKSAGYIAPMAGVVLLAISLVL
jgi:hypothetical protein